MTIQEDIQKIIEGIKIEEFQKKVLKKRPWFRGDTNIDPVPNYWENLINQINHSLAKELVDQVRELGDQVVEYDERIDQILLVLWYKEKYPDFEGLVYPGSPKAYYWTELKEKFKLSRRGDGSWRKLEDFN